MKRMKLSGILSVMIVLAACAAHAEDVTADGWRITPYAWLPVSISLDSTVEGTTVPIDMDLGDVFDTFDVFALSARAEYWRGQYGFVVDGIWTDLQGKGIQNPIPPIQSLTIDVQDGILDFMGAYRLALDDDGSIRVLGGLRYHYIKQEIAIIPTAPGPQQILGGRSGFC